ncbi:MAG: biotin--[acetyl-CoA-carboxylase] ligase [Dehalococcoidales bacterium]|nr:biotin--[acetyl-CoA-carboxylase] ligase [Dehalococcoidales bacterium]
MNDLFSGLVDRLDTRLIGREICYYQSIASTMDAARDKGLRREREGLVVVTDCQTGGRGRMGRFWFSPPGSLAISIVCYPDKTQVNELVMCGALSVLATIEKYGVKKAAIKWPNDILVNRKKISGVLVESRMFAGAVTYAVIGMGINVNSDLASFGKMVLEPTSLASELGKQVDMQEFFCRLLENTDRLYCDLKSSKSLFDRWKSRLITLGKEVTIAHSSTGLKGYAKDVTPNGNLVLQLESGEEVIISAGDVNLE